MIKWVYGNTLPLVVRLQEIIKTEVGETREDYIPPVGSEIEVWAVGQYKKKQFDYTIDGNTLFFSDDGTLSIGTYGIRVTVREPESRNLRSFKCEELEIVKCTDELELGEFVTTDAVVLDAATFFWAKGDKGDPFTYEDFTPEEIMDLKRPATEAAAEVEAFEQRIEAAETLRKQSEGIRQQNEQTRQNKEAQREQYMVAIRADYALVKRDAQTATDNANNKAAYAKEQGDYAKEKAGEIEDAKGEYQTLGARLDAMDEDTDSRLDKITEEQFDEIFNN